MRYIVVDASDHQLPYLFGTDAHQIGASYLAATLTAPEARSAIENAYYRSRQSPDEVIPPEYFTAPFEGMEHTFAAKGLRGTPWALLVYQPVREVDARLASTVGWAAGLWCGFALLAGLIILATSAFSGRRAWLWLWPRPGNAKVMTQAGNAILAICAVAVFALLACFDGVIAVLLIGVGVPLASVLIAWVWLTGRTAPPEDDEASVVIRNGCAKSIADWVLRVYASVVKTSANRDASNNATRQGTEPDNQSIQPDGKPDDMMRLVLLPADERGFSRLGIALLLALGVLPMWAVWVDSRADELASNAVNEIAHLEKAWKANREALSAIMKTYGLTTQPAKPGMEVMKEQPSLVWIGLHDFDAHASVEEPADPPRNTTTTLREMLEIGSRRVVPKCKEEKTRLPRHGYCVDEKGRVGLIEGQRPWRGEVSLPGTMGCVLVLIGLFAIVRSSFLGMTRALFGFGVPLEAVHYPGIVRKCAPQGEGCSGDKKPLLPDCAVVLNGPLALSIDLLGEADPLDLARAINSDESYERTLANQLHRLDIHRTVVVTNLDIALKDPKLRHRALTMLEALSDHAEKKSRMFTSEEAFGTKGHLVVITDQSPLDRILQAYERELDKNHDSDPSIRTIDSRMEEMRWSTPFETFTTYTLPVLAKFLWSSGQKSKLVERYLRDTSPDQAEGIIELIREVRFLPEAILHSLIDPDKIPTRSDWMNLNIESYPLQVQGYDTIYFDAICEWAIKVRPATRVAAVDYLHGILIEHYQHLWGTSSHGERVILDNLARGRVININAALAIRSLIRRGLVIFAPAPRLVNESFASFVRQAEKPEALKKLRNTQHRGGWDKMARPLAFILPGAIVVLAAMAIMAGESLVTVLPIILGAGPALLAALLSGRQSA